MEKHIWEGWTVQNFIEALYGEIDMIMSGNACRKPFVNREELCAYIRENQPFYKENIPEVNQYFITKYRL